MSTEGFVFSRNIPLEPGPKPSSKSLPVTLPIDQPPLAITDATSLISDVKASMFGFPLTEQRQFLLQELPKYGIDETTWGNTGKVSYIPNFGTVQLDISDLADDFYSSHQTKFAYKYQPGKQISISQAVQSKKGAAIENSFTQWGEFTKFDGYGWRLMTKKAATAFSGTNITPWHNYLFFFRRTSAVLPHLEGANREVKVTQCPCGIGTQPTGAPASVIINETRLYRPSYLVGQNGTDPNYLGLDTWEELAAASLGPLGSVTPYNKDQFTGLLGQGSPDTSGARSEFKSSAHEVSFVSDSYEISGCSTPTGGNLSIINCQTAIEVDGVSQTKLKPGMTVRSLDSSIQPGTVISTVTSTGITLSKPATSAISNQILFFNEETNLTMFLIQRSWYGGAGGRGLAYIPDKNPPFNGTTRWVTGHEVRIGDTLPVPSMSSPDLPITYLIGNRVGTGLGARDDGKNNRPLAFFRRFGVSVWIDGGDPRPAEIQSSSSTGKTVSRTSYTPLLALAVKPFVWNQSVQSKRPQKSRVYPLSLHIASTQNTEFYLVKNSTLANNQIIASDWYKGMQDTDNLKVVASLSNFSTLSINAVNGIIPDSAQLGGKLIGAFYCGQNESTEIELTEIFDPQRELLGRADILKEDVIGDTLLIIARSLSTTTNATVSCSIIYGVQ
jgi:hypothetical protein